MIVFAWTGNEGQSVFIKHAPIDVDTHTNVYTHTNVCTHTNAYTHTYTPNTHLQAQYINSIYTHKYIHTQIYK